MVDSCMIDKAGLMQRLRHLRRNEDGAPVIEFALVAPLFFLIIFGIIELGMIMCVTVLMESSLRDSSRYGVTGQLPDGASTMAAREQFIRDMIADRTLGLVDMNDAKVEILSYPTFEDVGQGEEFVDGNGNGDYDAGETFKDCNGNGKRDQDRGTAGPGGSGTVVLYRMRYEWPVMTPFAGPIIATDGKFPIQASIAVRNEPWNPTIGGPKPKACTL